MVEVLVAALFLATVVALALPQLRHPGSEARSAKQLALFGSLRAAAQITRAAAQIHGQTGTTGLVSIDGMRVSTVFGYPAASAAGIIAATGLDPATDRFSLSPGGPEPGNAITLSLDGAHAICTIVYVAPATPDGQPSINYTNADGDGGPGC
jgi:MSHA pilin protein MshA